MIGYDADHIHPQFADTRAIEQIDQAMVGLRYQYHNLARFVLRADLPGHPILVSDQAEAVDERSDVSFVAEIEDDAREETASFGVVELVRFEDVAAV